MWWLLATGWVRAGDFSEEAESRMGLSFDLDAVKESLADEPSPAAPSAARRSLSPNPTPSSVSPSLPPLPLEPNSTLTAVTVHRDRAFVVRERHEMLSTGWQALPFEGLPPAILAEGISARVVSGDARIVAVELRSGVGDVRDSARIAAVREEAEREVARLGTVRDRIESLLAQRAYLRTALVPEAATATPPIRRVRAGMDYVGSAEVKIAERLREEEDAARALDERVAPLLRKLADPLATGREVWVELEVAAPGPVAVALRYGVSGTGWVPAYNARLDPVTNEVELEVFGVVTQSTREDWTDAALFLATADPYDRATVPDLVPWTLGRSGGAGVFGTIDLGAEAPAAAPSSTRVVETRMDARVEDSGVVVLAIDGPRTIRGDGSPQRLPVAVQRLAAEVRLASVPKLAPSVQRRATVRYDGAVPLLPGPVAAFVRSDYVGSGQIRSVVPGEGLPLEFGTDERFRVSRQLIERRETRVGKGATRYDFRFRTTLVNHGDHDATVALVDQLPRSEDARIEVRVLDVSRGTPPGEDGLVRWDVPVAAGEDASVELAFSVTVPDPLHQRALFLGLLF